jgi:hypothetical protein
MTLLTNPKVFMCFEEADWVVECNQGNSELYINVAMLPLTGEMPFHVVDVGYELCQYLRLHPQASNKELTMVAIAACV